MVQVPHRAKDAIFETGLTRSDFTTRASPPADSSSSGAWRSFPGPDIRDTDRDPYRCGDDHAQHQSRLHRHHRVAIHADLDHGNRGNYPPQVATTGKVAKVGLGGYPPGSQPASFLILAFQVGIVQAI